MKKLYFLLLLFTTIFANAQAPFITTWEVVENDEFNLNIILPIVGTENNFTVDFGDGTVLQNQTEIVTHTYTVAGVYTLTVSGDFEGIDFAAFGTRQIRSIEQWGDVQWQIMRFTGCKKLVINATDVPDLSNVTDMNFAFQGCYSLYQSPNQSLNNWDVSNVISMVDMFAGATNFNLSLDNWDVSNVTDMTEMFAGANSFNQSLDNWDVSSVITMSKMFYGAKGFNSSIANWDVSNVKKMDEMFMYAETFNQPIDSWNVSSVITMERMFNSANMFNQSLNSWDVSNVTKMDQMFQGASAFNGNIENWDVSNVINMYHMFSGAISFNQPINNWNISNVFDLTEMFQLAQSFNQPLDNWDVSNANNLNKLFNGAYNFNQDISGWDYSNHIQLVDFVSYTAMNTDNYDALLLKLAQTGLVGGRLSSDNIEYCDYGVRDYLINELNWEIENDNLSESCEGNTFTGTIRFDSNGNSCDTAIVSSGNFLIEAMEGTFKYATSALNGQYDLKVFDGVYNIELLNVPDYFNVTPVTPEFTFEGYGNIETLNFCLTANETINDLNVTLLPVEEARPGFETDYQLVVQNMGTHSVATATVNLSFDDALQTFVSANPAPTATTTNELTFTITDLEPFQSRIIDLKTKLFEPPVVNGGEISNFMATITPNNNDFTPNDNTFKLAQTIVNSFDPNDKRVLQGEEIFVSQTDDYLNYIIRFQNTGTASAITVKVKDMLSENLDWNTFQMISASHNYRVSIKEGNQVEFVFDNINLPHETANEPGSHGFIAYKIKPIANLQIGDVINGNTSSIYFDYNLPIITNATTTTIVENLDPIEISATITNVSCNGEDDGSATVSVTGGSGTYSYAWSPSGGSEATATGLAAGDYIVTVSDGFDSETLSITITEPEAITISTQPEDEVLVEGGNTVFSVVATNVEEYQWQVSSDGTNWNDISNGGTSPSYTGVTTNTINITGMPLSYNGYKYRVLLSNGDNCITYSDDANAEVNAVAGIDSYNDLGIKIYPNPSKSLVFVNVTDVTSYANLKISVLDINGRILLEEPISDNLKNIDLLNFQSGMYIFTISSDKFRFSKYIIKE
ncbi:hypothetical protein D3C87_603770 [compost metagenome]